MCNRFLLPNDRRLPRVTNAGVTGFGPGPTTFSGLNEQTPAAIGCLSISIQEFFNFRYYFGDKQ